MANPSFESSMTQMRDYFDDGTDINDNNNNNNNHNDSYDNKSHNNVNYFNNDDHNIDHQHHNETYSNDEKKYFENTDSSYHNNFYKNPNSFQNRNYHKNFHNRSNNKYNNQYKNNYNNYNNNDNNNNDHEYEQNNRFRFQKTSKQIYRVKDNARNNNNFNNNYDNNNRHKFSSHSEDVLTNDFKNMNINSRNTNNNKKYYKKQNNDNTNDHENDNNNDNDNNDDIGNDDNNHNTIRNIQKKHRYAESNLSERSKEMIEQLWNEEYNCMVCHSIVGRKGRIWTCKHCHVIFHMSCINRWAFAREQKEAEEEHRPPKEQHLIKSIRCPACNYVDNQFKMDKYYCYCGKQCLDYMIDRNDYYNNGIPHSCGELCERYRGTTSECEHCCMAQCHPGPCDPCRLPSAKIYKCECGKMQYNLRCGQQELEPKLCSLKCEKFLNCKNHKCDLQCHHGPCPTCPIKFVANCFCGKEKKEIHCGEGKEIELENGQKEIRYKCNNICNKLLSCGNHNCTFECHSGSCSNCSRKVVVPTICACGKTTFSGDDINDNQNNKNKNKKINNELVIRKSCLDPLPTCSNKCDRMLSCGIHFCKQKCHDSKCPTCNIPIKKLCRCKAETKTLKCSEYYAKLQQINNGIVGVDVDIELITNPDSFVRCKRICRKILNCGYHTCKTVCCGGRNVVGYQGHVCREKCLRTLSCGRHSCNSNCHAGTCPPCGVTYRNGITCACGNISIPGPIQCSTTEIIKCQRKCEKLLPCGHECSMKCHYGKCDTKCSILDDKPCLNHGNLVHNIPCHVQYPSCGQQCNQLLPCQQHRCTRVCHNDRCIANDDEFNNVMTKGCSNPCNKMLRCGHLCSQKCHPNIITCNERLCQFKISVKCTCGNRSEQQYCAGRNGYEIKAILCNEQCVIEDRNKRFREAFNINKSDDNNNNNNKTENTKRIPYATNTLQRCLKYMKNEFKKENPSKLLPNVIEPTFITYIENMLSAYINDTSDDCHEFKKKYPKIEILIPKIPSNSNQDENEMKLQQKYYPSICIPHVRDKEERYIIHHIAIQYFVLSEKDDSQKSIGMRLLKTSQSSIPYYLLSQAIIEYQTNPSKLITLEAYPPECIIVVDNASNISSSMLQDRLIAWTGDYRMWRNENNTLYIVFTNEELRNAALGSILVKFNGRKATNDDSLGVSQVVSIKKQQQNDNKKKKENKKKKKKENKLNMNKDGWQISGKNDSDIIPQNQNNNNNNNNLTNELNTINFSSGFH